MKVLVKPECNLEIDSRMLEAQMPMCEPYCFCVGLCICDDKISGWADDDTEDILF